MLRSLVRQHEENSVVLHQKPSHPWPPPKKKKIIYIIYWITYFKTREIYIIYVKYSATLLSLGIIKKEQFLLSNGIFISLIYTKHPRKL